MINCVIIFLMILCANHQYIHLHVINWRIMADLQTLLPVIDTKRRGFSSNFEKPLVSRSLSSKFVIIEPSLHFWGKSTIFGTYLVAFYDDAKYCSVRLLYTMLQKQRNRKHMRSSGFALQASTQILLYIVLGVFSKQDQNSVYVLFVSRHSV